MELLNFVATVIFVTASGALAPGPLFFANLSEGAKSGAKSGLMFSVTHSLVEFSLVLLLALGLLSAASEPIVKALIGIAGGVVLVVFGALQIRDSFASTFKEPVVRKATSGTLFAKGIAFTGLNPFFVVWWLTAGAQLIIISLEFAALAGVVLMYVCHVWMDYAWLISTAHFTKIGKSVVGFRLYRYVVAAFGVILIYFGLTFLLNAHSLE